MAFLKPDNLDCYRESFALSNYVWGIVARWEWFAKKTTGAQYTEAVDSISALVAEGFGRYFKKDKINFYRMARGSVIEAIDWTEKAHLRRLISDKEYLYIRQKLEKLPKLINQLISYTKLKLKE